MKKKKIVKRYINQELSHLRFNERVLDIAMRPHLAAFERLKFNAIFESNMDEYFGLRLSRIHAALDGQVTERQPDIDEPEHLYCQILERAKENQHRSEKNIRSIVKELEHDFVTIRAAKDLTPAERQYVNDYVDQQVIPLLAPMTFDLTHPFPRLKTLSLYVAYELDEVGPHGRPAQAIVLVPSEIPRFVRLPSNDKSKHIFILSEDLVKLCGDKIFPASSPRNSYVFRVTRDLDYEISEERLHDIRDAVLSHLQNDSNGRGILRFETERTMPQGLQNRIRRILGISFNEVFASDGPLQIKDFFFLRKCMPASSEGDKNTVFKNYPNPRLEGCGDVFAEIKKGDLLLYHPYETFRHMTDFFLAAARDPNVVVIKQTLYRLGKQSPIAEALIEAAKNGKNVTAVVELKARFDEKLNYQWAKRMEEAGVHVVYGFASVKTHAKCTLIVRKEAEKLVRYAHLSTGNYNADTADSYVDFGYLTARTDYTAEVESLFNLLVGYRVSRKNTKIERINQFFKKLVIAPYLLREFLTTQIRNEATLARAGKPGRIILKLNAINDDQLINELYSASDAGVQIDLVVRGICSVRAGIEGLSENIRVKSIVDHYLEHSRLYWFSNNGKPVVCLGSADLMPRNLNKRVEFLWRVDDVAQQSFLMNILQTYLADTEASFVLGPDGEYTTVKSKGASGVRCQTVFSQWAKDGFKKIQNVRVLKDAPKKKAKPKSAPSASMRSKKKAG